MQTCCPGTDLGPAATWLPHPGIGQVGAAAQCTACMAMGVHARRLCDHRGDKSMLRGQVQALCWPLALLCAAARPAQAMPERQLRAHARGYHLKRTDYTVSSIPSPESLPGASAVCRPQHMAPAQQNQAPCTWSLPRAPPLAGRRDKRSSATMPRGHSSTVPHATRPQPHQAEHPETHTARPTPPRPRCRDAPRADIPDRPAAAAATKRRRLQTA